MQTSDEYAERAMATNDPVYGLLAIAAAIKEAADPEPLLGAGELVDLLFHRNPDGGVS